MQKANRGIITASFGDRDVSEFTRNIRKYTDLPILIYTDRRYALVPEIRHTSEFATFGDCEPGIDLCAVDTIWHDHKRYGQRNGDYWQAYGALTCPFDEVLYLDDDMRIVSPEFIQGFELAEHFGLCLPLNPRGIVSIDGTIGADVTGKPEIPLATAYNCGTMFFNRNNFKATQYLQNWVNIMYVTPQRGPMAAFRAALRTNFSPYTLQYNWCVCSEHIDIDNPIIVHAGHKDVKEKYKCEHS